MPRQLALLLGLSILAGCQPPPAAAPAPLGAVSFSLGRTPSSGANAAPSEVRTSEGPAAPPSEAPRLELPERPEPGGGQGGGQGGAPSAGAMAGRVRDAYEVPVPGAVVRLADGRSATTQRDGSFSLAGAWSDGPVLVSKPGYITSIAYGLEGLGVLHLRPDAGPTAPFDANRYTVTGTVAWPDGDHVGGVVYYHDSLDSVANPVPLSPDGSFSFELTTRRPGTPTGLVLVLASDSQDRTLMGLSRPFAPQAGAPLTVAMHLADQPIAYSAADQPAATPRVESRLEIRQPGVPPMVLDGAAATSGLFSLPAPGLLPGEAQVVVEASDPERSIVSRLVLTPAGGAANGRMLPIPGVAYDPTLRKLSWAEVPGATGYRIEAGPRGASQPAWEAWLPEGSEIRLPDEAWLQQGQTEVRLEVIDSLGLEPYAVAAAGLMRQLRLAPWIAAGSHRLSSKRLPI